ncbi:single-stranded DNA-binding protein [Saccharothrix obliqua]|uniref:single-stranded DNA-binding protein n=1 Tax=Saccharothrix obliqua TaxID=2861747 RepID=UPI001C5CD64A|nr:single-stranded DNA-binding protein [Saccharothrix obliqua]MBW4720792.1 single-stranded DNA-binding protein [Saccharothrix obliqua]
MAYNETRVTVAGIVASKVVRTVVGTGYSRAAFRVHTRERRFDRDREEWFDGSTMFLMVTCWRDLADNVHACLDKGDPVLVHGKLRIRETAENGVTSQHIDIEATAVGPNLVACTARPSRTRDAPAVVAPREEDEHALSPPLVAPGAVPAPRAAEPAPKEVPAISH